MHSIYLGGKRKRCLSSFQQQINVKFYVINFCVMMAKCYIYTGAVKIGTGKINAITGKL